MAQHSRNPITVRLDRFEGPLDLLLHLIQSHELDISAVSVSKVTDQYLAYVRVMHELNFDVASEFLVMAATLIYWKSKAILPREDGEESSEESDEDVGISQTELIRRLLEHQRFLAAGDELKALPRLHVDVFARPNSKPPVERIWREMNLTDLGLSFQDTLVRERKRKKVLRKETVSLSEKLIQFSDRLQIGRMTPMEELIANQNLRPEVVVTFLASLELSRLRKLKVYQNQTYDPIYLELIERISRAELQLASGFDQPPEEAPKEEAPETEAPQETVQ